MIRAEDIARVRAEAIEDVRMARIDAKQGAPLTVADLDEVERVYTSEREYTRDERHTWRVHARCALEDP